MLSVRLALQTLLLILPPLLPFFPLTTSSTFSQSRPGSHFRRRSDPLFTQAAGPVSVALRRGFSDQRSVTDQTLPGPALMAALLNIVTPFMSQIAFSPVVPLCHRMSDLPSPSKSPTPAILQLMSSPPTGELTESVVPFMNQIAFSPVAPLCHRMSDLPSPSKSPTPAMLQLRSATVATAVALETLMPFMR